MPLRGPYLQRSGAHFRLDVQQPLNHSAVEAPCSSQPGCYVFALQPNQQHLNNPVVVQQHVHRASGHVQ